MLAFFTDTETTGLLRREAEPWSDLQPHMIEIGAVLFDVGSGEEVASFGTLISPVDPGAPADYFGAPSLRWTVPEEATAIHGITTQDCIERGMPLKQAMNLYSDLQKHADRMVFQNGDFDINVLWIEGWRSLGKPRKTRPGAWQRVPIGIDDTTLMGLGLGLPLSSHGKGPSLKHLERYFFGMANSERGGAHRALQDARRGAFVYLAFKQGWPMHESLEAPGAWVEAFGVERVNVESRKAGSFTGARLEGPGLTGAEPMEIDPALGRIVERVLGEEPAAVDSGFDGEGASAGENSAGGNGAQGDPATGCISPIETPSAELSSSEEVRP